MPTHEELVAQLQREREGAERVYAEYQRLRHLMFTAPTDEERHAALRALAPILAVRARPGDVSLHNGDDDPVAAADTMPPQPESTPPSPQHSGEYMTATGR